MGDLLERDEERRELARLRAENEALRGQIAALREAANLAVPNHPKHPALNRALADTEAAAREHNEAVRAQAFKEAAR